MAREILFKAKRTDNGEWETGYYFKAGEKHMMLCFFTNENGLYHNMYEIDPKTLCQYTGLNDKNGNKIWENDIVEITAEDEYFKVRWSDTEARYEMTSAYLVVDFDNYWSDEVEVIGNVFDNPDLLEGENG